MSSEKTHANKRSFSGAKRKRPIKVGMALNKVNDIIMANAKLDKDDEVDESIKQAKKDFRAYTKKKEKLYEGGFNLECDKL